MASLSELILSEKQRLRFQFRFLLLAALKQNRIKEVMDAGADGIALISGILGAKDIKEKTGEFLGLL